MRNIIVIVIEYVWANERAHFNNNDLFYENVGVFVKSYILC